MGGVLATASIFSTAMVSTLPINADVYDSINQTKITCETKLVCKELSGFIQAQINELEQSKKPDFDRLDILQKQLIALEKSETALNESLIAAENKKQNEQEKTIVSEQAETMNITKTGQKIEELRGALLEK